MKFLRRKQNEHKNQPATKSSSDKYTKSNPNPDRHFQLNGRDRRYTHIETSDSVTVYTDVLNSSDYLPHSYSMSTVATGASNNYNNAYNSDNTSKSCSKGKSSSSRFRRGRINGVSSMTSLDRKIVETEEKVKLQIRQLASGSFDDIMESDEEHETPNRNVTYKEETGDKVGTRLISTAGVLLFDGLVEDIPDDKSLQSLIRKERQSMANDYYDDNDENDPSSSNKLLSDEKAPVPKTNFITAPKNYDPVGSGFMKPDHARKSFYDSDDDEEDESKRTMGTASGSTHASSSTFGLKQETFDPAIEVVLNERSHLYYL